MNYSFSVEHAQQYGVDEAILINYFIYSLSQNLFKPEHQYMNKTCVENSLRSFKVYFPFWTENKITTLLNSLVNHGVIVIHKGSNTLYSFKNESLFLGSK
jgi:hypothetical protein